VFVEWLFHVLIAAGLLWLRARHAELPRPYRSPAYPLLPLVYALFAVYLVVATVWQNDPEKTLVGGGITALGLVVFAVWQRLAPAPR
jgi:APA family basic amino acid/polyamine antiporter